MHLLHDISWLYWLPLLGFWSNSGGNTSNPTTTTETSTTSGSGAPSATGGSQAIAPGSIGVAGTGAKYLESGASDLSGAQLGGLQGSSLSASGGATVNIGDPNAVEALGQIADQLATQAANPTVVSTGSSGSSGGAASFIEPLTQNINWTMIAIAGAAVLAIYLFFGGKNK